MPYPKLNIKFVPFAAVVVIVMLSLGACSGIPPQTETTTQPAEKAPAKQQAVRFGYPVEVLQNKNACYELEASYPFTGRPELDQQIRLWVDTLYHDAVSEFEAACAQTPELGGKQQFMLDYELFNTPQVFSVVFHSWAYTGGAHGNDSVQTMNLRLNNGDDLSYNDLFAKPAGLWEFLSDYVYTKLKPELGGYWSEVPEFTEGLEPVEKSFVNFAVTPKGITLFFPTYQIAPYSAGPQQCEVPLSALVKFVPRPNIWQ